MCHNKTKNGKDQKKRRRMDFLGFQLGVVLTLPIPYFVPYKQRMDNIRTTLKNGLSWYSIRRGSYFAHSLFCTIQTKNGQHKNNVKEWTFFVFN